MSKNKKDGNAGLRRKKLVAIAKSLKIENAAMVSNADLLRAILDRKPINMKWAGSIKAQIIALVSWFQENEPEATATRKKAKQVKSGTAAYSRLRAEFYGSWEWRTIRMKALKEHGARCQCCGAGRDDTAMSGEPVKICVDHIKPLATHWDLRLEPSNLQVLCDECNQGKGAWDETDWRGRELVEAQLRYVI